jgi:hypothetical protein
MIRRCYNPKNVKDFPNYGGRGIKVCDRWLNSFEDFVEDVGEVPSPNHQLDRVDNNGDYEPGNVRWATKSEQMINRRLQRNNVSGYKGVSYDKKRDMWWAQIKRNNVRTYLGHFNSFDEAVKARKLAEQSSKEQPVQPVAIL